MAKVNWVFAHDAESSEDEQGRSMAYALECKRCGDVQHVASPIAIDVYIAMMAAFSKIHRQCKGQLKGN